MFPWGSFVFFEDPDGNRWALQQLPVREGVVKSRRPCQSNKSLTGYSPQMVDN
jgi:hypothetical protein